jgi:hypothetical protein
MAIALALVITHPAFAITVILKNKNEPIRGFLVHEDGRQIQVRVLQSDGTFIEKTIAKAEIDLVHRPVDAQRFNSPARGRIASEGPGILVRLPRSCGSEPHRPVPRYLAPWLLSAVPETARAASILRNVSWRRGVEPVKPV